MELTKFTFMLISLMLTFLVPLTQAATTMRRSGNTDRGMKAPMSTTRAAVTTKVNMANGKLQQKQLPNLQAKRDISLSYSATDIDSKEGSRVKTITVIKNLNKNGKGEKVAINSELHKNEDWANSFRDNFDSYGTIPDVPDIDDLFEFMNKKTESKISKEKAKNKPSSSSSAAAAKPSSQRPPMPEQRKPVKEVAVNADAGDGGDSVEKPVVEPAMEMQTMPPKATKEKDYSDKSSSSVEKIKGDAEFIPLNIASSNGAKASPNNKSTNNSSSSNAMRSQSLLSMTKERLVSVNYSTPQHSVQQYFENYIQQTPKGYDYAKPCVNGQPNTVTVSTPSGRTYDVPPASNAAGVNVNPYIAPAVVKRPTTTAFQGQPYPPLVQVNQQPQPSVPTYSVNSIVPPLQSNQGGGGGYAGVSSTTLRTPSQIFPQLTANQQPSQQPQPQLVNVNGGFSTSQRPYVAPNLRNGLGFGRGATPTPTPTYNVVTVAPNYRTNTFGVGINKPNFARSRGLKY